MAEVAFIGDELTAAGFRLAGLRVYTADPERLAEQFRQVLSEALLVIVTGEVADQLPQAQFRQAVALARPPVAVVPAAVSPAEGLDLEREVHVTLGMEA